MISHAERMTFITLSKYHWKPEADQAAEFPTLCFNILPLIKVHKINFGTLDLFPLPQRLLQAGTLQPVPHEVAIKWENY